MGNGNSNDCDDGDADADADGDPDDADVTDDAGDCEKANMTFLIINVVCCC